MRTSSNLFEDDEDLFRADPPELIDGQPAGANDDSGGDTADGQMIETGFSAPLQDAHSDWNLANGGPAKAAPDSDKFMDNEQMAADDNGKSEADAELDEGDKSHESPLGDNNNSADSVTASRPASGPSGWPAGSLDHRQDGASVTAAAAAAHSKLMARLVHRIAPELGCYTATGELYRGHVASSSDSRACLNWLQVRQALGSGNSAGDRPNSKSANSPDANHNYCRNPSAAQRGPWCFVAYSELLDGPLLMRPANQTGGKFVSRRGRVVRMGARQQLFVSRPCRIASCSEYLWLYVVAPPLGLLLLLTCLASLLVKSIRKSHYKSIFSAAYRRHSNSSSCRPGPARGSPKRGCLIAGNLRKVFKSRFLGSPSGCRRARGHKVTGRQPTSKANYLDDDIFEIVDDIDWSDGQAHSQSLSPKSNESFRLHSASFDSAAGASSGSAAPPNGHQKPPIQSGGRSTLSHSKSITPVFSERALIDVGAPVPPPRLASNMSKSKSQAGPMFATLRCHVRQTQQRRQVDALKQQASEWSSLSLQESSATAMGTQTATPTTISTGDAIKTGHLISCSSSSSSSNNALSSVANGDQDQCILVNELPRLERTNVTISCEVQPIYEGKFSQVQMAYRMQHESDRTQATGRIGAQVAVCALKQQAALDESVFQASRLKVRNLNHLNLLKLIGYVQFDGAASPGDVMTPPSATCGLIYDMAHLIDLSDWLKEQSKEAVIAQRDEISGDLTLRQNLACLSKQIALALDYLHDKNIVYKDLACRNCFLDATRMLVKLASFNIELEFDKNISIGGDQQTNNAGADNLVGAVGDNSKPDSDITGGSASPAAADNDDAMALMASRRSNLKSMVRPKYLLDYYVIDSRPSECQLLPLSWIPLESILFNKFNKQTDIWSFGCLIYELFSLGEVAYFGYSSKQVIDSVRSNMMPPQPLLCPNGIYKLMCKCLSDIPTLRPNIKHIYEQLNLYSGQCSSFLNHHLCTM